MTSGARSRIWLPAVAVALAVAAATALAGNLLLRAALRHSLPILEDSTRTGASAVGAAVAGQFARALELGIPLDRLTGVETYLLRIVEGSPQVTGLALLGADGQTVAATGSDVQGEEFAIEVGDATATLVVAAGSPLAGEALMRIRATLLLAALLAGAVAGALAAGHLGLVQEPARQRLRHAVARAAEGDFAAADLEEQRGRFDAAAQAMRLCVERVEAARQKLAEAVATIRAIDFDGSLGRQVEAIVRPLEARYRLPDERDGEAAQGAGAPAGDGAVWRTAAIAGLYAASFPFVANFAIDRGTQAIPAAWVTVVPLLAELAALAAGAWIARRGGGGSKWPGAAAVLLLGAALAATFWCRTYDLFVLLRTGAGFGAGFALALAMRSWPPSVPARLVPAVLVFAAFVAAPMLAGLAGEAIGRRAAFLALGAGVLALAPFAPRQPGQGASGDRGPLDWRLALAAAPAAAVVLVAAPSGIGYDNYLAGAGVAAVFGLAALVAPRLPAPSSGVLLVAAAAALHQGWPQPAAAIYVAAAAVGAALGTLLSGREASGRAASGAILAGTGAGLVAAGLAAQQGLPPAIVPAAAGLLSIAVALAFRRPAADRG